MLTQTLALFIDAYRELNAKKLFWITLVLSGLLVLAFAAVGINAQGLTIFHWQVPFALNTTMISKEMFYKQLLFTNLGVRFWLGWGAAILALVSTAGMIPDFVTGGSLPVMLAKPVSRLRLFLTKYLSGLLFVAMQVTVFCTASFFVLGFRAGVWEPSLFVAVPLVIAFFSFLFSVCALVGLLTRSTIAALIITAMFWFMLFAVNTTEQALLMFRTFNEQRVEQYDQLLATERGRLESATGAAPTGIMNALKDGIITREGREDRIRTLEERREDADRVRGSVTKWHNGVFIAKTILPKTTETVQLTERTLVDMAELEVMMMEDDGGNGDGIRTSREDRELGVSIDGDEVAREIVRKQRSRSVLWIVGTSLLFEAFILSIACWVFCRRDY
jgi:hypothetical protein